MAKKAANSPFLVVSLFKYAIADRLVFMKLPRKPTFQDSGVCVFIGGDPFGKRPKKDQGRVTE